MSDGDTLANYSHMLQEIFTRLQSEEYAAHRESLERWIELYNRESLPSNRKSFKSLKQMTKEMTDSQNVGDTCAICLDSVCNKVEIPDDYAIREELQTDPETFRSQIVVMPCKHRYHYFCLTLWLEKEQTCPTCRQKVKTDSEYEEEERERNLQELHDSMYS